MSRVLRLIFVLGYLVLCFATLAYWLPNFFAVNFPQQSNFFSAAHLCVCAASVGWNLYHHRKELACLERVAAAAAT